VAKSRITAWPHEGGASIKTGLPLRIVHPVTLLAEAYRRNGG
jgi:hypothetical protein